MVPISKEECCGCSICAHICPKAAIVMKPDSEGFLYPEVDTGKCVSCGLCRNACAFSSYVQPEKDKHDFYLVKHKNTDVRMDSQSGGVFTAVSDWILEQQGLVYGCILDKDMKAKHARAENKEQRNKMCKSKYVQSEIDSVLADIADDLRDGRFVLFTGTGCQVDGVLSYMKAKRVPTEKLYTMDIICHGCASPMLFADYIAWLEKKFKSKVEDFNFRDKRLRGWDGHVESYRISGKKRMSTVWRQIYHTDLCLRPSCTNCHYSTVNRRADITTGDAWGIKKVRPEFNDNRGVSLTIIQSEKGEQLLSYMKSVCDVESIEQEKMLQGCLVHPAKPTGNREQFWKTYDSEHIDGLIRRYGQVTFKKKVKSFFGYRARKILQRNKYYLP